MVKKVADLYEQYGPDKGCGPDLKRIAMWLVVIIVVAGIIISIWR
jgi:hypothetical protein